MNEEALAKEGAEPLRKFVSEIGGWGLSARKPIVNDSSWSIENLLLQMYEMNFNPILLISVVTDDKNTSRNVIVVCKNLLITHSAPKTWIFIHSKIDYMFWNFNNNFVEIHIFVNI